MATSMLKPVVGIIECWPIELRVWGWQDVVWKEAVLGDGNRFKILVAATHPVTQVRVKREIKFRYPKNLAIRREVMFNQRDRVRQSLGTPESFSASNAPLTLELTEEP